jgi:hypothetical protein
LNIEQLLQASEFNDKIRLLINRSARA